VERKGQQQACVDAKDKNFQEGQKAFRKQQAQSVQDMNFGEFSFSGLTPSQIK
jgi:hypothetical protein